MTFRKECTKVGAVLRKEHLIPGISLMSDEKGRRKTFNSKRDGRGCFVVCAPRVKTARIQYLLQLVIKMAEEVVEEKPFIKITCLV